MSDAPTEWLFSYGTLQQEGVQLATFGRRLDGRPDRLPGFRLAEVRITDPHVLAESGKAIHPIASPSADPADAIEGMVFQVTPAELTDADRYEVADYKRVGTRLASGIKAWVYVAAGDVGVSKFV
jgi:gamma-glutamylcyclotransferase (GGCT)/AIG2-like uncharacterized protein YtfP